MKTQKDFAMPYLIQRRSLLKFIGATVAGTVLAGGTTTLYASNIEPSWLEVVQQVLHLPRLDAAFHNYRITQISDLHADDTWHGRIWINKARVAETVQLVNQQHADAIVITGDFVTHIQEQTPDTLSPLQDLQARDGVFAILGNHDHWSDPQMVRQLLKQFHIHDLSDSYHTFSRGQTQLHLIGLDDLWPQNALIAPLRSHQTRLQHILQHIPSTGAAILLVHEPDFADVAASIGRFDLQLSGHSHGGQVQLPLYGVLQVPPLAEHYPVGLYQTKGMLHYTNRGIGMVSPHVRFDCRPEITVFQLMSSSHALA